MNSDVTLFTLLFTTLFLATLTGLALVLMTPPFKFGTCQSCGFDLQFHGRSATHRTCPECGQEIPRIGRHRPRYRVGQWLLIGGVILMFVASFIGGALG
jgi:predicted RNA-binding Zn-ribbon protein involved in translation (DUF1610 family)